MGLIAREVESRGIATVSLTSAWSITEAVRPPRAAFVDFPLGHTAGKPNRPGLQREIVVSTLELIETLERPGEIVDLGYRWSSDDSWRDRAMSTDGGDDRIERYDSPQYQTEEDRRLADQAGSCDSCVFLAD